MTENERFGLISLKTGSINPGTGVKIFPNADLGAWMDGEVLEGSDLGVVPAAVPCPVHGEHVIGEDLAEDEL